MTTAYEELIQNTRLYIDYIDDHYNNVQRAFRQLKLVFKDNPLIKNDWHYLILKSCIEQHDKSKFYPEEFAQYRLNFFTCKDEVKDPDEFGIAWKHHYTNNHHHWQYWTLPENDTNGILTLRMQIALFETVVDWTAMGYRFGNTALDYFTKHKAEITLPEFAMDYLEGLCIESNK